MQAEDQDALRKFNEEWDNAHSTEDTKPPINANDLAGNAGQGQPGLADQIAANAANLMTNTGTYQPPVIPTTGDSCAQCGTMHPAIGPGEVCPVAVELGKVDPKGNPILPTDATQPPVSSFTPDEKPLEAQPDKTEPIKEPTPAPEPLSEENRPEKIPPQHPVTTQQPTQPVERAEPEPAPLADNNIPAEVHINKYLQSWSDIIKAHCNTHSIVNVKRLMRHLTVEVTDFLEHNKGR